MIRDNQKYFNRLQVVLDGLVIVISYLIAWYIMIRSVDRDEVGVLPAEVYLMVLLMVVPFLLLLYYACNLYAPKRIQGRRLEGGNILKANTICGLTLMAALFWFKQGDVSRIVLGVFLALNVTLTVIERNVVRMVLMNARRIGLNQKYVILVGYSRAAEEYIDRIVQNPQWGYKILGILDDNVVAGTLYKNIEVLGFTESLSHILEDSHPDEIAITLGLNEYDKLEHIVAMCEKSGVHTKFIPDYSKIIPTKPYTEDLLGLPVVNIRHVPLTNTFNMMVKRVFDLVGASICIVLFSPVMLLTAILIKLTSKGPLIFTQERVGLHNRPFKMYKFRSMEVQSKQEEKEGWTTKNDPRVTGIGKFIRRTSIDELPQLFNVLKGEMSLIGPRPERPQFVEKFREEIPRYMVKHQVRPGMTGWAQVNGYRGNTSIKKRIDYDLYYIENWTIGLDIKILFLTVFKGFVNKNAY
ncbi:MAG: undecaprenyl-phosphate glucose phosphotransferase [Lachnospiraceae bacterium]|uniref:undecaprenyl-phosphate glucose phosphotransferase n=1 Tax=Parablautia sp. Marseille-Q6255 TaxID=3039593 RepID=UPI0024BCA185|nr:undecaprenyl-phosphate glucose phosphotransferase [Parablautia sp. Marseille-Q6255]